MTRRNEKTLSRSKGYPLFGGVMQQEQQRGRNKRLDRVGRQNYFPFSIVKVQVSVTRIAKPSLISFEERMNGLNRRNMTSITYEKNERVKLEQEPILKEARER